MKNLFILIYIFNSSLFSYIIIEHKPIKHFIPDYRIKFDATMKDYYHNFISAQLKFKAYSEEFYKINMKCTKENICSATIPAPKKTTKEITYFIEATDNIGDSYKTQNFIIPHIEIPSWQVDDGQSIEIEANSKIIKNTSLDDFSEKVQIRFIDNKSNNSYKVESRFRPPEEKEMLKPKNQKIEKSQIKSVSIKSLDLTGIWSIRRSLSSCKSGITSHKVIKIKSFNGNITSSTNFQKGTKFFYSDKDGYLCQLIDDSQSGNLVGSSSIYTYESFFNSLKLSLGRGEHVKLLDFSKNKIVFELHAKDVILTTTYKREQKNIFFQ